MEHQNIPVCDLQNKIVLEEKLSLAYAAILAENVLYRFDERVREGVAQWLDDTLPETFAVEDILLAEIKQMFGVSTFQGLCITDIILKNDEFPQMVDWQEESDFIHVE